MENKKKTEKKSNIGKILLFVMLGFGLFIIIFFILIIFLAVFGLFSGGSSSSFKTGNIALIDVNGMIVGDSSGALFSTEASSKKLVDLIEQADKNKNINAIIFMVNSPGGSAVATDEIANAIKKTDKTTVAVIREVGASGAYWIASSCDYIFANKMSIVGSIGVTSSHLGFEGFIDRYNISYRRIVTGEYKDIGTPFREMNEEEINLIKEQLLVLHDVFVDEIAQNRNMEKNDAEKLANGLFWSGVDAKKLNLIDDFGGKKEAIEYIEKKLNIESKTVEMQKPPTFMDLLIGVVNDNFYSFGYGFAAALLKEKNKNNVAYL
ncbi:MAG: signal peptide peptidase SppA [Candidatus Woesearchaeota archaeon]